MKKLVLFLCLTIFSLNVYSQNTIKFLGIPIDGTKKEMGAKLKAKGYEYNSYLDCYTGEFNGTDVRIYIQTVNNKVWRLSVVDMNSTNETNIKIRFNNLFDQFSNNGKYFLVGGEKVTESERLSYEITVNKKRYQAVFSLLDNPLGGTVWYMIGEEYGDYRIAMFYENQNNAAKGDDL